MTTTLLAEFPDYPVDTLPAIPAGFIPQHWHNDVCPSWRDPTRSLELWIDYPAAADREVPGTPRYTLVFGDFEDERDGARTVIESTDDWDAILAALTWRIDP